MRARRAFVLAALLLGPAACGRSCGCVEGEKTYESLDGKVKVDLVRTVRWTDGKIPGPATTFLLRVHTLPVIEHPIACDRVDMAEDDEGKLVAWRCRTGVPGEPHTSWSVLRLRGGDRHLVECDPPLGGGKKPRWADLEPLSRAANRILDCLDRSHEQRAHATSSWIELARSIEEDEGADAAVGFFVSSAARPHPGRNGDAWAVALASRPPAVRDRVLRRVCPALSRGDSSAPLYVRAAEHCPLDAPGVGDAAVAQLRAALVRPVRPLEGDERRGDAGSARGDGGDAGGDVLHGSQELALAWAAVIAVTRAPAAAGAAACAVAPELSDETAMHGAPVSPRAVGATVLAFTKTQCEAARAWLEPPPCTKRLDCNGAFCSAADLASELETWAQQGTRPLGGGPRDDPALPRDRERSLLALAYAQGPPLDRDLVLRNVRRHYVWPEAGADAVSCDQADAALGTPCACHPGDLTDTFCMLDAGATRASKDTCSFHIDDAKKRIDDVRRNCDPPGSRCYRAASCCDGLACEQPEGGGGPFCTR